MRTKLLSVKGKIRNALSTAHFQYNLLCANALNSALVTMGNKAYCVRSRYANLTWCNNIRGTAHKMSKFIRDP